MTCPARRAAWRPVAGSSARRPYRSCVRTWPSRSRARRGQARWRWAVSPRAGKSGRTASNAARICARWACCRLASSALQQTTSRRRRSPSPDHHVRHVEGRGHHAIAARPGADRLGHLVAGLHRHAADGRAAPLGQGPEGRLGAQPGVPDDDAAGQRPALEIGLHLRPGRDLHGVAAEDPGAHGQAIPGHGEAHEHLGDVGSLMLRVPPLPPGGVRLRPREWAPPERGVRRVLGVDRTVERGRVVADPLHVARAEVCDPDAQRLLERRLVRLKAVHGPVEMGQVARPGPRAPHGLSAPLLVAVERGGRGQTPIGHHRDAGPLHGEGPPRVILGQGRASRRQADPLPARLEDIEVAVGPGVRPLPVGAFGDHLLRGHPAQAAPRQRPPPLADVRVIGPADVVDDARVRPPRRFVPHALGTLQVGNRPAAGPLLGALPEDQVRRSTTTLRWQGLSRNPWTRTFG